MNKPNQPTVNPAKPGDQTQPSKSAPPFGKTQRPQDPKETAQEAVHQVMSKDDKADLDKKDKDGSKPAYLPNPAQDDVKPPLHAARGNDEVMSLQPGKAS